MLKLDKTNRTQLTNQFPNQFTTHFTNKPTNITHTLVNFILFVTGTSALAATVSPDFCVLATFVVAAAAAAAAVAAFVFRFRFTTSVTTTENSGQEVGLVK